MAHNPRLYKNITAHNYNVILRLRTGDIITREDADIIKKFLSELQSANGASEMRATHITSIIVTWRRFIRKPFKEWTIDDVYDGIAALKNGSSLAGKPFTRNSVRDYEKDLKQFLKWMVKRKIVEISLDDIAQIKPPKADEDTTNPEDLPTMEEIMQIIKSCRTSRQRAFIAILYESGARVGELTRLTWKDARSERVSDVDTISLSIDDEKTHQRRHSRLTIAVPYMAAYKADQSIVNPDDFIFKDQQGQSMTYPGAYNFFIRIIIHSGIRKHITPHDMRRARATHMAQLGYQESVVKLSLWNNVGTRQSKRYFRLSDKDIDNEFLKQAGVPQDDKSKIDMRPVPCPKCHTPNPPGAEYCYKDGTPLSRKAIAEHKDNEEEAAKLASDPDILQKMINDAVAKALAQKTENA
jgi:site-specific recombinase XerD